METYQTCVVPAPTYMGCPLFTHISSLVSQRSGGRDEHGAPAVESLLSAVTTLDEAAAVITTAVIGKLASLRSIAPEDISSEKSISSNGIDSLNTMEFRTFLAREVKADVPVLNIMGTLGVSQLCRKIAALSKAMDVQASPES